MINFNLKKRHAKSLILLSLAPLFLSSTGMSHEFRAYSSTGRSELFRTPDETVLQINHQEFQRIDEPEQPATAVFEFLSTDGGLPIVTPRAFMEAVHGEQISCWRKPIQVSGKLLGHEVTCGMFINAAGSIYTVDDPIRLGADGIHQSAYVSGSAQVSASPTSRTRSNDRSYTLKIQGPTARAVYEALPRGTSRRHIRYGRDITCTIKSGTGHECAFPIDHRGRIVN